MRKIFGFTGVNSSAWAGLDLFNKFWAGHVKTASQLTDYETKVQSQEEFLINSFLQIIPTYHTIYDDLKSNLKLDIEKTVQEQYFTQDKACDDSRKESKVRDVAEIIDKYLWNLIFERLEILDSIVHTYFSIICVSRSAHIPLAIKFMQNAIMYCLAPIFAAVPTPPTKYKINENMNEQEKKNTNERAEIHEFFTRHTTEFKSALDKMFTPTGNSESGLHKSIKKFELDDKTALKNSFSSNIMVAKGGGGERTLVGPKAQKDAETEYFKKIEKFVTDHLESVSQIDLEKKIDKNTKLYDGTIRVHRSKGMKLDILNKINGILKPENSSILSNVKKIVYQNIYFDSVSYATFHYKTYDSSLMLPENYLRRIFHPFSLSLNAKAVISTEFKAKRTEDVRAVSRARYSDINTERKVLGDMTQEAKDIIVLNKDFAPSASTSAQGSPQAQKTAGKKSKKGAKDKKKKKGTGGTPGKKKNPNQPKGKGGGGGKKKEKK